MGVFARRIGSEKYFHFFTVPGCRLVLLASMTAEGIGFTSWTLVLEMALPMGGCSSRSAASSRRWAIEDVRVG